VSGKRENGKDRDLPNDDSRRSFLYNALMGTGLVVSHLTALGFIVRYLYPTKNETKQRLFVGLKSEIPPGSAIVYEAPGGKTVNVVRGQRGFVALSDVCPHLGCRVHWDSANDEFLCPCHDGHFDANGIATAGPPLDMGGQLPQYNVSIDGDMVFLEMEVTS
jgi:cytochrome b6-f complex iron-sulfur subunit